MPHDLFGDVVSPRVRVRSNSRYTILLSIAAHALIVCAVVIVPLMATGVLPTPASGALDFIDVAPLPSPPPMPAPPAARPAAAPVSDAAPTEAPKGITDEVPRQVSTDTAEGALTLGTGPTHGLGAGGVGLTVEAMPLPPPIPRAPDRPLRVGTGIREPTKIHHVVPVYPQIAMSARISGTVVVDAVIGTDGLVRHARVLKGSPLLNQAALDAVSQWRYTPTTLNGVPVQVIMTVMVTFKLQE